jgi:hypothetical protein
MKIALLSLALCAGLASGQNILWDETVDGDLSNFGLTPSNGGTLAAGANLVRGSTGPGSGLTGDEGYDILTFNVAAGFTVTSIVLNAYDPSGTTSTSGFVLFSGNQGTDSLNPFLGGVSWGTANVGAELLSSISSGPLGPGDYTFEVREFGGPRSTWEIQINAIPAPGAMALLGIGGLAATRRRR